MINSNERIIKHKIGLTSAPFSLDHRIVPLVWLTKPFLVLPVFDIHIIPMLLSYLTFVKVVNMTSKKPAASFDTAQMILEKSIPLFAQSGFAGVSMRDISKVVGISGAALYHHYPDKQSLYIAAMEHAFADKASSIETALDNTGTPEEQLERFVTNFTKQMSNDPDFRALLQRELLDGDDERLKLLADNVFVEPFKAIKQLAQEMALDCNPHLMAISIAGLILFHFETESIRRYLPGGLKKHNDPKVIAQHVIKLLTGAIGK